MYTGSVKSYAQIYLADSVNEVLDLMANNWKYKLCSAFEEIHEATLLKTEAEWEALGRFVVDDLRSGYATVLVPNPHGKMVHATVPIYDVGQTDGADISKA